MARGLRSCGGPLFVSMSAMMGSCGSSRGRQYPRQVSLSGALMGSHGGSRVLCFHGPQICGRPFPRAHTHRSVRGLSPPSACPPARPPARLPARPPASAGPASRSCPSVRPSVRLRPSLFARAAARTCVRARALFRHVRRVRVVPVCRSVPARLRADGVGHRPACVRARVCVRVCAHTPVSHEHSASVRVCVWVHV